MSHQPGCNVVMVTGWGSTDTTQWVAEDRVFVCKSAPHEWLFPLVSQNSTHCLLVHLRYTPLVSGSYRPIPCMGLQESCTPVRTQKSWCLQASAVIHHGGAGTTARALWSAVPSVVFPILSFYDQPGWAALLEEQGLGVRCDHSYGGHAVGSVDAQRLALERALALPRDRISKMGSTVRSEQGVLR